MHVLQLPSWYATSERPALGTFFRDQSLAVARTGVRVGVAFCEPRSLKSIGLGALVENHFQVASADEQGLPTIRQYGWNPIAQVKWGGQVWSWLTLRLIRAYIRQHGRPDLIHAQSVFWAGEAARFAARRLHIPFVLTEHSSRFLDVALPRGTAETARQVFRASRAVLAVSEALKTSIQRIDSGLDVKVVPNTIDTDFWRFPPDGRAEGAFSFLGVGHLVKLKGFDLLLAAFASRFKGSSTESITIVGEGPERENLERLAETLGISRQVRFLGQLDREGVRQEMWKAHCFVLASWVETFGVVVIEALATGLPVIATRSGGPEEILAQQDGMLIPPGDEQSLANALWIARTRKSASADLLRASVRNRYDYSVIGERLKAVYLRALAGQAPAEGAATISGLSRRSVAGR